MSWILFGDAKSREDLQEILTSIYGALDLNSVLSWKPPSVMMDTPPTLPSMGSTSQVISELMDRGQPQFLPEENFSYTEQEPGETSTSIRASALDLPLYKFLEDKSEKVPPYNAPYGWNNKPHYQDVISMKKANVVIRYFKCRPCSGGIKHSIRRYFHGYEQCARQLEHFLPDMACCFASTIELPARDIFFDKIKQYVRFPAIVVLMEAEFDSPTRKASVQTDLERIPLQTFMSANKFTSTTTGLSKIIARMNMFTPLAPPLFSDKQHTKHSPSYSCCHILPVGAKSPQRAFYQQNLREPHCCCFSRVTTTR